LFSYTFASVDSKELSWVQIKLAAREAATVVSEGYITTDAMEVKDEMIRL
jgi:hypothetical protein